MFSLIHMSTACYYSATLHYLVLLWNYSFWGPLKYYLTCYYYSNSLIFSNYTFSYLIGKGWFSRWEYYHIWLCPSDERNGRQCRTSAATKDDMN